MKQPALTRRRFLQATSCIGCGLLIPGIVRAANIRQLSGSVFINNNPALPGDVIRSGDRVTTSHNGRISFVIGSDAYLLKEKTSLVVEQSSGSIIKSLRLLTGKLLSVFVKGPEREIVTSSSTIGIRGTACFLNVQSTSTYFCTCYGETELRTNGKIEEFEATHHNAHQLDFDGMAFIGMQAMKVIDHTDDELRELEGYVGRVPSFDQS